MILWENTVPGIKRPLIFCAMSSPLQLCIVLVI